ncbi:MAG: hypothetical protein V8R58_07205 [Faecalibacillus faecis]
MDEQIGFNLEEVLLFMKSAPANIFFKIQNVNIVLPQKFVLLSMVEKKIVLLEKQIKKFKKIRN